MAIKKLIGGVHLLFEKNNKILFLRRKGTGYKDGELSLVAGHVDEGEEYRVAGVREAMEELGVKINIDDLEFVHVQNRKGVKGERLDIYFKVLRWTYEIRNLETEYCSELIWTDIKKIENEIIEYVLDALKKINKGEKYSIWNY